MHTVGGLPECPFHTLGFCVQGEAYVTWRESLTLASLLDYRFKPVFPQTVTFLL